MKSIRSVLLAGALGACMPAMATEGGGNAYPLGVETNNSGIMRPQGFTYFLYFQDYDADAIKDNGGRDNAAFQSFGLHSDALSLRVTYVWPGVKWLGASVETRGAVPVVALDRDANRFLPNGALLNLDAERTSMGDLTIMPIGLGWHGKHLHQTLAVEGFLPTGSYDVARPLNTGRNAYQLAPFYALTYFSGTGFEASAKLRYAKNYTNDNTDYRSGDEATLEFAAGYQFTPKVQLGINGYLYRQTSDDRQRGVSVSGNGNRGRVDAVGPYIRYTFSKKVAVLLKGQPEFNAENRPEGTRIWLQTILPF